MKRRNFIVNSSLFAFSVGAFGAISWNGKSFVGNSPTTSDILGPFYRPGAPIRSNLLIPGTDGSILNLSGTIYDMDGNTPLRDTLIEIWHASEKGEYDNTSPDYRYRAALKTDKNGKYDFKTVMPPAYKADETHYRPAHVHFRISSDKKQDLITQIYFKGDQYLEKDPSSAAPDSIHRILPFSKNNKNESDVIFDVTLRDSYVLEPVAMQKITGLYAVDNNKAKAEFIAKDDLLIYKENGQYTETLVYKGNNEFEGGHGFYKAKFEFSLEGETKVKISERYFESEHKVVEGIKILKY